MMTMKKVQKAIKYSSNASSCSLNRKQGIFRNNLINNILFNDDVTIQITYVVNKNNYTLVLNWQKYTLFTWVSRRFECITFSSQKKNNY